MGRGRAYNRVLRLRRGDMGSFAIAGAITGILLGWRFNVIALIPGIMGTVIVVTVLNIAHHQSPRAAITGLLSTLVSLQIGYVLGRVFEIAIHSHRSRQINARYRRSHSKVPRY
jgi:hypothetical protein